MAAAFATTGSRTVSAMSNPHLPAGPDENRHLELLSEHRELSEPTVAPPQSNGRGSARTWVLASLLVAGLAGAAALGTFGWRVADQRDTALTTPDQLAGLHRVVDADAAQTEEDLRTAIAAGINLDDSVAAIYRSADDADRPVLVFGGTTLIWQPERDLDTLIHDLATDAATEEVPAGRYGGVMKCGLASDETGMFAVCGWADHGSAVLALFPGRTVEEAAPLLREMREQMQSRG